MEMVKLEDAALLALNVDPDNLLNDAAPADEPDDFELLVEICASARHFGFQRIAQHRTPAARATLPQSRQGAVSYFSATAGAPASRTEHASRTTFRLARCVVH